MFLIHDTLDEAVPFDDLMQVESMFLVNHIRKTSNLGHRRILNSNELSQFLNELLYVSDMPKI